MTFPYVKQTPQDVKYKKRDMPVLLATFANHSSLAQPAIITTTSTTTACGKINTSVLS